MDRLNMQFSSYKAGWVVKSPGCRGWWRYHNCRCYCRRLVGRLLQASSQGHPPNHHLRVIPEGCCQVQRNPYQDQYPSEAHGQTVAVAERRYLTQLQGRLTALFPPLTNRRRCCYEGHWPNHRHKCRPQRYSFDQKTRVSIRTRNPLLTM